MSKHIYVDKKHRFQASINDDGQIDGLIGITASKLSEILDKLEGRSATTKAPRTISAEKLERVVDAIAYEMSRSSVRGSKVENAAHAVLETLGITVGD